MTGSPARRANPGAIPPDFAPPRRLFQKLPEWLRGPLREAVGRSARLGYILRDFRGR